MHQNNICVVAVFFTAAVYSILGLDLASPGLNLSTLTSTSRRGLVHCEITFDIADVRPETLSAIATPTDISGSGCADARAVTSLTLKTATDDTALLSVDLLPVCRFSSVERVTLVGRLNESMMTSLSCFRNIRHVTLKRADIDVVRPSLIYERFRSRDFRSVSVLESGVSELAAGVLDGRRLPWLEDIDLSINNLTELANATFVNLATLKSVNLSHNAIRHIASYAFANIGIRYSIMNCYALHNTSVITLDYAMTIFTAQCTTKRNRPVLQGENEHRSHKNANVNKTHIRTLTCENSKI